MMMAPPWDKRVDEPSYVRDVVGEIERWDERDIVFARRDLFRYFEPDSREREGYYATHPDLLERDSEWSDVPPIGATGGVDAPMFESQLAAIRSMAPESLVDGRPSAERVAVTPGRAAKKLRAFAGLLGADLVGIGRLRQEWIYSHVGRTFGNSEDFQAWGAPIDLTSHTSAIALGFRMDHELIQSAPDFPVLVATARGYGLGAWVSMQLAHYIRMLGYSARAHHMYNYQVLAVPVAVDCGLGELSRAGFLMTREFGLGLRLAVVTTEMPVEHDSPVDIGVQSFCEACKICALSCPAGAIPTGDKTEFNGVRKWKLDEDRCYRYWHRVGTDCALCMTSCPWTKPRNWLHALAAHAASITGPHQPLMVLAERLLYGRFRGRPRPDYMDPRKR
jgi:reductive dehalogenase